MSDFIPGRTYRLGEVPVKHPIPLPASPLKGEEKIFSDSLFQGAEWKTGPVNSLLS